jgi:hypothetical protein
MSIISQGANCYLSLINCQKYILDLQITLLVLVKYAKHLIKELYYTNYFHVNNLR